MTEINQASINSINPDMITGVPDFENLGEDNTKIPVFEEPNALATATEPISDYTIKSKDLYGDVYRDRPQIGSDSPIDGGVYFGTYGGEAIVVDSEKYPEPFNELYETVLGQVTNENGKVDKGKILETVFGAVKDKMKYSQEGVDNYLKSIADDEGKDKFVDGTKVSIGDFIQGGFGVCRHQALTTGFLLEKLKKAGHLNGEVSVDRSRRWSPNGDPEGHAWTRYTTSTGDVMILDVAQDYYGPLELSEDVKRGWDYLRPDERKNRTARDIGHTALPELDVAV